MQKKISMEYPRNGEGRMPMMMKCFEKEESDNQGIGSENNCSVLSEGDVVFNINFDYFLHCESLYKCNTCIYIHI